MTRPAHLLFGLVLLLWLALASTARAGDGAYEINADCAAVGCFAGDTAGSPVTLSLPGAYVLTSDLVGVRVSIAAGATDIDLDLKGHTIDGGGRCSGTPGGPVSCIGVPIGAGIAFAAQGAGVYYHAKIHGGTVRGWDLGIDAESLGGGSAFEDLTVSDNNNIAAAFYFDKTEPGASITVARSSVVRNRSDGMRPAQYAGAPAFKLVVDESTFSNNGNLGLQVFAGSVVTRSRFLDNANFGFSCGTAPPPATAAGSNVFFGNKPASANSEYSCTLRDMGGNVCLDGGCP